MNFLGPGILFDIIGKELPETEVVEGAAKLANDAAVDAASYVGEEALNASEHLPAVGNIIHKGRVFTNTFLKSARTKIGEVESDVGDWVEKKSESMFGKDGYTTKKIDELLQKHKEEMKKLAETDEQGNPIANVSEKKIDNAKTYTGEETIDDALAHDKVTDPAIHNIATKAIMDNFTKNVAKSFPYLEDMIYNEPGIIDRFSGFSGFSDAEKLEKLEKPDITGDTTAPSSLSANAAETVRNFINNSLKPSGGGLSEVRGRLIDVKPGKSQYPKYFPDYKQEFNPGNIDHPFIPQNGVITGLEKPLEIPKSFYLKNDPTQLKQSPSILSELNKLENTNDNFVAGLLNSRNLTNFQKYKLLEPYLNGDKEIYNLSKNTKSIMDRFMQYEQYNHPELKDLNSMTNNIAKKFKRENIGAVLPAVERDIAEAAERAKLSPIQRKIKAAKELGLEEPLLPRADKLEKLETQPETTYIRATRPVIHGESIPGAGKLKLKEVDEVLSKQGLDKTIELETFSKDNNLSNIKTMDFSQEPLDTMSRASDESLIKLEEDEARAKRELDSKSPLPPEELAQDVEEVVETEEKKSSYGDAIKTGLIAAGASATTIALFDKLVNKKDTNMKDLNIVKDLESDFKKTKDLFTNVKAAFDNLRNMWNTSGGGVSDQRQKEIQQQMQMKQRELASLGAALQGKEIKMNRTMKGMLEKKNREELIKERQKMKDDKDNKTKNLDEMLERGVLSKSTPFPTAFPTIKIINNLQSPESDFDSRNSKTVNLKKQYKSKTKNKYPKTEDDDE